MPSDWNDLEERLLINERKNRNAEYHALKNGQPKQAFWDNIAQKINHQRKTTFTGKQCHNKFLNLT
jgi:Myb/SANT-like DNA-binding domain